MFLLAMSLQITQDSVDLHQLLKTLPIHISLNIHCSSINLYFLNQESKGYHPSFDNIWDFSWNK